MYGMGYNPMSGYGEYSSIEIKSPAEKIRVRENGVKLDKWIQKDFNNLPSEVKVAISYMGPTNWPTFVNKDLNNKLRDYDLLIAGNWGQSFESLDLSNHTEIANIFRGAKDRGLARVIESDKSIEGLYATERLLESLRGGAYNEGDYEAIVARELARDEKGAVKRPNEEPYTGEKKPHTPYKAGISNETGTVEEGVVSADLNPEPFQQGNEIQSELIFADNQITINLATKQYTPDTMSQEEADDTVAGWVEHARSQYGMKQGADGKANYEKTIVSLFDRSGNWARPYIEAGYEVILVDIQDGVDIEDIDAQWVFDQIQNPGDIYGVLAACPCTTFSQAATRYDKGWEKANADGTTTAAQRVVANTLDFIDFAKPAFWAIENPANSRMGDTIGGKRGKGEAEEINNATGLPRPKLNFQPHNFGTPLTKPTSLWGSFNTNLPLANVEPGGSTTNQAGGYSQETMNVRAETPLPFAYAFFMANNAIDGNSEETLKNLYPAMSGAISAGLQNGVDLDSLIEIAEKHHEWGFDNSEGITAVYEAALAVTGAAPQTQNLDDKQAEFDRLMAQMSNEGQTLTDFIQSGGETDLGSVNFEPEGVESETFIKELTAQEQAAQQEEDNSPLAKARENSKTPLQEIEVTETLDVEGVGEVEVTQSAEDAIKDCDAALSVFEEFGACLLPK